jgi:hypothetical protein
MKARNEKPGARPGSSAAKCGGRLIAAGVCYPRSARAPRVVVSVVVDDVPPDVPA